MNVRKLDDRFSVTAQIGPERMDEVAALGFRAVVCARPDHEEPGQPPFAEIARAARERGLEAVHVPMSGMPGPDQAAAFARAMAGIEGPVLGYCRSGTRAANLYATLVR